MTSHNAISVDSPKDEAVSVLKQMEKDKMSALQNGCLPTEFVNVLRNQQRQIRAPVFPVMFSEAVPVLSFPFAISCDSFVKEADGSPWLPPPLQWNVLELDYTHPPSVYSKLRSSLSPKPFHKHSFECLQSLQEFQLAIPIPVPTGLVAMNQLKNGKLHIGIFALDDISAVGHTYGPMPAENLPLHNNTEPLKWMLYVTRSTFPMEANLTVVRRDEHLFFKIIRLIPRHAELVLFIGEIQQDKAAPAQSKPESAEDGFKCERCGRIFAYQYYRDKHMKYTRCVDNGDRKYPCNLCNRSFDKRDRLRIHTLHVHEKRRPYKCAMCGKHFSQSSSLSKHLRVHSGERPYKCLHCSKAFTASSILRTHTRQHSGEKPFKCQYCGKAFASHAAHDSHVRRTHRTDEMDRKYCTSASVSYSAEEIIDVVS